MRNIQPPSGFATGLRGPSYHTQVTTCEGGMLAFLGTQLLAYQFEQRALCLSVRGMDCMYVMAVDLSRVYLPYLDQAGHGSLRYLFTVRRAGTSRT